MENREILKRVDHTLLNPCATWDEIRKLCGEAMEHGTASVCIPPSYVGRVRKEYGGLVICTVIGFPLGYASGAVKAAELREALSAGADEFDMVVNLGDVKNGDFDKVTKEIASLKALAGEKTLKVIVETCYLTDGEKAALCRAVTDGGADYIKTSTGFGSAGASLEDIKLFKEHVGQGVKIKAAGGIRGREDMAAFIEAGCERIGSSSAVKALAGNREGGGSDGNEGLYG